MKREPDAAKQISRGIIVLALSSSVFAQAPPGPPRFPVPGPGPRDTFQLIGPELAFEGRVVKGAPYAAQAVTEHAQTLADGNRIQRTMTASVYRDSDGRTRREQSLVGIGPFVPEGTPPRIVVITDPVAGVNYFLDAEHHVARKMPARRGLGRIGPPPQASGAPDPGALRGPSPQPPPGRRGGGPAGRQRQVVSESLGTQTVEGVLAEGTRTTITIPAGAIGNDQPIQSVNERWYAPDLQTVVMTRHTDPRVGDMTYRLTNITRGDPSPDLFTVPAGYTITGAPKGGPRARPGPGGGRRMRRPRN